MISTCSGKICLPSEEYIIAAVEDTYVLVAGSRMYYFVPNLKASQLSRYLGKTVRVKGVTALEGNAISADSSEAFVDGQWRPFARPQIMDRAEKLGGVPYKF